MKVLHSVDSLRDAVPTPGSTALVPTMGNLHDGHLALVRHARESGRTVVASIFVNRLQFGPGDDFERYPRTLVQDCERLESVGCDIVFAPGEADFYPSPQRYTVRPDPALAGILEGAFRPGFFDGVCTVVMKLFCCVQPSIAIFGKKDYQQWRVLTRMVEQFSMPITVVGIETERAADGLALSSRNGYLTPEERSRAAELHAALRRLVAAAGAGPPIPAEQAAREQSALQALARQGWHPDYLTVRRRDDLQPPGPGDPSPRVALGAARLGATRLIDNIEF